MRNRPPARLPLAAACLLATASSAMAQQVGGALPMPGIGTTATTGLPQVAGAGSGPAGDRAWSIRPRINMTMTATDNSRVGGGADGKSDLITQIAPGIRIDTRSKRLRGYFDYSLRGQHYLNDSYSRTQNALNSFVTFEAVDDWLFIDVSGNIAQQSISAFGTQSPDNLRNNNSTETSTYRISPYIRGKLGSAVDYQLRYNASTTRSDAATVSGIDIGQWIGRLNGSTPFQNLRWSIDANRQTVDYSNGRQSDADLLRAVGTYSITPQFRISLSSGWERNNYASLDQESRTTHGYGFDWNPTPRTQVSAFKESRFFGDGHRFSFNHRWPMSSILYTDTKDVSVLPNQFSATYTDQNLAQLELLVTQFCTQREGPNASPSAIQTCVAQLLGQNFNSQVTSSFLSTRANVQRQQQLAYVLYGARNSLTLRANRSENSSVFAADPSIDFNQNSNIRQRGLSVSFTHRLSPLSNLNGTASRQQSTGQGIGGTSQKTTTTSYIVSASTKLGPKTTGSLSLRRTEFDNATNPYTENAVLGSVTYTY